MVPHDLAHQRAVSSSTGPVCTCAKAKCHSGPPGRRHRVCPHFQVCYVCHPHLQTLHTHTYTQAKQNKIKQTKAKTNLKTKTQMVLETELQTTRHVQTRSRDTNSKRGTNAQLYCCPHVTHTLTRTPRTIHINQKFDFSPELQFPNV